MRTHTTDGPFHAAYRRFLMGLVFFVVLPGFLYTYVVFRTMGEVRVQYAMDRNLQSATLAAQLLDERGRAAVVALRAVAKRPGIRRALRIPNVASASATAEARAATEIVPGLFYVSLMDRNGGRIADWSPQFRDVTRLVDLKRPPAPWRPDGVELIGMVDLADRLGVEAIVLAAPVDRDGYVIGCYRLTEASTWRQLLGLRERARAAVLAPDGQVLSRFADEGATASAAETTILKRIAALEQLGTVRLLSDDGATLIGFADAAVSHWKVAVWLPASLTTSPIDFMSYRLFLLFVPALVLLLIVFLGAGRLAAAYRQQAYMAETLTAQNEKLRAEDRTRAEFMANVSHDLWTPLAGIQLSISGLLDPHVKWSPEQVREHLVLADQEVEHMISRVRNLLEMARLESGTFQTTKEPVELQDLAASAVERLTPLLQGRHVEYVFPTAPLLVEGRAAQLEVVIVNLLENAIKYSPSGSTLLFRGEFHGKDIFLSLRDEGIGVKPAEAKTIFEKFYRAPEVRYMGGTGLGLALCKAIIEQHGGDIGVMSPPGGGAEFWFSLPTMTPRKDTHW